MTAPPFPRTISPSTTASSCARATRLRGKIDYTDVAFHLLRDMQAFSLSELQIVFEAVLDQQLDASNFRRGILTRYENSGRLTQTDQAKKQGRGRPAALYRFD